MTLLSIAQAVADEVGLPRPASVAGSSDQLSRQMFALANATLRDLTKMSWPALITDVSFNTQVGVSQYTLPTDFKRIVGNSAYNTSQYQRLRASLSAAEFQRQRYGGFGGIGIFKVRLVGYPSKINVTPVPQVVQNIAYEYVSKNAVVKADTTTAELFALDDDDTIIPAELVHLGLKWRIKHAKGLDYAEDFNEYENSKNQLFAQLLALEDLPVAVRGGGDFDGVTDGYVRENGFG